MDNIFDSIDRIVMQTISESHEEGATILNQYQNSKILQREINPVGWYTDFQVATNCPRLSITRGDVGFANASVKGMESGIGFQLWIDNGMLAQLEAFTYGENLPEHIEIISIVNN
jgi:hypothetical protein